MQSEIWRLIGRKIAKIASSYPPSLINRPRTGCLFSDFGMSWIFPKTRMFGLSDGEEIMTLALFVLIQCGFVTDGQQTDGHVCRKDRARASKKPAAPQSPDPTVKPPVYMHSATYIEICRHYARQKRQCCSKMTVTRHFGYY